ncbi:MAG: response regulator [Patescibacteria group bacterium]
MARIQVVDDEEGVRKLFCIILRGAGHEAYPAEGGRDGVLEALLRLSHGRPDDLLLTDLTMPKVNGLFMVTAMAYACCLPPRVIMVSGDFGDSDTIEKCRREIGVLASLPSAKFDFLLLAKPISEVNLLEAVNTLLAGKVE